MEPNKKLVAGLTAAVLYCYHHPKAPAKFDWKGTSALPAGLALRTSAGTISPGILCESWAHPEIWPSYGVAFAVCLTGRVLQGAAIQLRTRFA